MLNLWINYHDIYVYIIYININIYKTYTHVYIYIQCIYYKSGHMYTQDFVLSAMLGSTRGYKLDFPKLKQEYHRTI